MKSHVGFAALCDMGSIISSLRRVAATPGGLLCTWNITGTPAVFPAEFGVYKPSCIHNAFVPSCAAYTNQYRVPAVQHQMSPELRRRTLRPNANGLAGGTGNGHPLRHSGRHMQLVIERGELLKSLSHVTSVVERRTTIPILSNVLLQASGSALRFNATDLEREVD